MRRVISAVVVAAGVLALCLLVPPWVRQAAILLAAVYACREAVRMAGAICAPQNEPGEPESRNIQIPGLVVTILLMLLLASPGLPPTLFDWLGWMGALTWFSIVPILLMMVIAIFALTLPAIPQTLGWLGAVSLAAAWVGMPSLALLGLSSGENGGRILLFLLATVMVGEAGAFFGGKLVGGPRLAPSLSPGKTWAGLVAQLVFGAAAGAAAVPLLSPELGPWAGAGLGAWLSAAAALGDLFESFWKRAAGRKDSGRIIPGHGGLLDRIDGVLFGALALMPRPGVVVPI